MNTLDITKETTPLGLRNFVNNKLKTQNYDIIKINRKQALEMNEWSDITYKQITTSRVEVVWLTIFGKITIEIEKL